MTPAAAKPQTRSKAQQALQLRADHVAPLVDRAGSLVRLKRYEEALAAYEAVLAQRGDHLGALNECGGLQTRLGCPQRALSYYDRALALAPRTVELHINKGTALAALHRFEDALKSFNAAALIAPERAEAHYNASLVQLRLGDFAAGWRGYEWRWRKADWAVSRRNFSAPLWLGEQPLEGKTILLHAEQGFGDTVQFIRYAALAARRGARVLLECQAELTRLLRNSEGVAQVIARGEALPRFDLHCPLMSLPLAFGTQLGTIPANIPYLRPAQECLIEWRARLPASGRLRVGLCWAGSGMHLNDRNRSIALDRFARLLTLPNLDFISLQKEVSAAQAGILRAHGVVEIGEGFRDFADTAAVIAALDLVIAVDTAAAHLAAAMGKAVALLLPFTPDFRWLLERTDSPWYPTMRLFRQTAMGDWDGPLERLRQELADVARRPVSATASG